MKTVLRYIFISLAVVLLGIGGILAYVKFILPDVGAAPELKIKATQAQIERGKYLANHVNVCLDCHSTRDWTRYSGPPTPGTLGKGGERYGREMGLPGTFYSRNITPAGLGDWTDGEIFRAISSGVNRHGKALFPLMPYTAYGKMDREDIKSVIAYLRTIQPIPNKIPASEADFPMNFLMNTIPQQPKFEKRPDPSHSVAYGRYLVNAAGCADCHTKTDQGKPVPGMDFAGGVEINFPGSVIRTANLTPDKETGLGLWTKAAFIARFKAFDPASGYKPHSVKSGEKQTIMPWTMYSGMSEQDLGAIYAYLQTLKPVKNKVETFMATAPVKGNLAQK
ncbi:MAG: c-type cytochrome [Spirosomataceae bacterium]